VSLVATIRTLLALPPTVTEQGAFLRTSCAT